MSQNSQGLSDLLQCLLSWLSANRSDSNAFRVVNALASEALKKAGSADPSQREFDAEQLAAAAGEEKNSFDACKKWVERADVELFMSHRATLIETYFRQHGKDHALRISKRSTSGKHRAVWFLDPYPLPVEEAPGNYRPKFDANVPGSSAALRYDVTAPGAVQVACYAKLFVGAGTFVTRSWRGWLWLGLLAIPAAFLLASYISAIGYTRLDRPLTTAHLSNLVFGASVVWAVWRITIRPFVWLLSDRIVLASDLWLAWSESDAQWELALDDQSRRTLRLVRYSATCPVCAGRVLLRYGYGPDHRRLFGCCTESPHEHVFTFDRVSGLGLPVRHVAVPDA